MLPAERMRDCFVKSKVNVPSGGHEDGVGVGRQGAEHRGSPGAASESRAVALLERRDDRPPENDVRNRIHQRCPATLPFLYIGSACALLDCRQGALLAEFHAGPPEGWTATTVWRLADKATCGSLPPVLALELRHGPLRQPIVGVVLRVPIAIEVVPVLGVPPNPNCELVGKLLRRFLNGLVPRRVGR